MSSAISNPAQPATQRWNSPASTRQIVNTSAPPKVSVGILTRNGGKLFAKVLDALCAQQTPWPFEIVILDSSSKDGTDSCAESRGVRVVPYKPKRFIFGNARDTLFENCRGEVIVTISQDVVPADAYWLEKIVAPILAGTVDATVGQQKVQPDGYAFYWDYHGSWMRTIAVRFDQAYGKVAISGANLAMRRTTWEKLHFGDVAAIEDRVMQVKLFRAGCKMMQVKDAWSYHGHDYTWKELSGRVGSFAQGFAELGYPYTLRHLLRDLIQPSRYLLPLRAFFNRDLVNWKELVFPVAMCFIQYRAARKK